MGDTDESGDEGLGSLFVCEQYIVKTWNINNTQQSLFCSNMSSVRSQNIIYLLLYYLFK